MVTGPVVPFLFDLSERKVAARWLSQWQLSNWCLASQYLLIHQWSIIICNRLLSCMHIWQTNEQKTSSKSTCRNSHSSAGRRCPEMFPRLVGNNWVPQVTHPYFLPQSQALHILVDSQACSILKGLRWSSPTSLQFHDRLPDLFGRPIKGTISSRSTPDSGEIFRILDVYIRGNLTIT